MSSKQVGQQTPALPTTRQSIFCLEGDWDERGFRSRLTVEHLLRLMQETRRIADYTRRDVATKEELRYYLSRLRSVKRFKIIFLAFHGTEDGLDLSRAASVSLAELAELADGAFEGASVHLGACSIIADQSSAELRSFCRQSGARSISGYQEDVDWVQSAMLDLAVLDALAWKSQVPRVFRAMTTEHPWLSETLGLRIASRTYDSAASAVSP